MSVFSSAVALHRGKVGLVSRIAYVLSCIGLRPDLVPSVVNTLRVFSVIFFKFFNLSSSLMQVSFAPPGTQGANLDIAAAYRNLPVLPDHRRYLCCQINGEYFMDHCFPFGACSAHNRLGITIDAVVDILEAVGISPVPKWADDLFPIRYADRSYVNANGHTIFHYRYNLSSFKEVLAPLCIPWHASKWNDFSSTPIYLGLVWDFDCHTVALAEPKRLKYLSKVVDFIRVYSNSRVPKKVAMSILGTLSHVTVVHQEGRSYLSALSAFISTFTSEHKPRYPRSAVLKDLEWWAVKLSQPGVTRALASRGEVLDLGIWVDASKTWGIGIVIGDRWDAWQWKAPWHFEGRNIGWAEAVAVELVARILLERGLSNAAVLIRGDNQGVIGSFGRGRGKNFHVNLAVRRTDIIASSSNMVYILEYVDSSHNKADPFSRGEMGLFEKKITEYISLPEELCPFLEHV